MMKLFVWIFGLIGGLFLFIGIWMLLDTQRFVARASPAPGVVIELLRTRDSDGDVLYKPLVRYETAAGATVEFTSNGASRPAAYDVGEAVTVLYDPAHPHKARLKGQWALWGLSTIFAGLGTVFFLIGASVGLWPWWRTRRMRWLRERGDLVLASFDRVALDTRVSYNGHHPWRVHAHWVDPLTARRHAFCSDMLWEDPCGYWDRRAIPVYIERNRPSRYAMDLVMRSEDHETSA